MKNTSEYEELRIIEGLVRNAHGWTILILGIYFLRSEEIYGEWAKKSKMSRRWKETKQKT